MLGEYQAIVEEQKAEIEAKKRRSVAVALRLTIRSARSVLVYRVSVLCLAAPA